MQQTQYRLYAPSMGSNLLSVSLIGHASQRVVMNKDSCHTEKNGILLAQVSRRDGLYYMNTCVDHPSLLPTVALVSDLNLWHHRMEHVHVDGIRDMMRNRVVDGLNVDQNNSKTCCERFVLSKITRAPIPHQGGGTRQERPGFGPHGRCWSVPSFIERSISLLCVFCVRSV